MAVDAPVLNLATLTAVEGLPAPGFDREARALYTALRESGFALMDCTRVPSAGDGRHPIVASVFGPAKRFFAKPHEQKLEAEELGYRPADSGRGPELFELQLGGGNREMPDFCAKAKLALAHVLGDARDVLLAVGWTLAPNQPDRLTCLLDNRPLPLGGMSASRLRVLRYGPTAALTERVDRGLVTFAFAPSGGTHALELFDQRRGEWVRPPASACVLLVGHTLEAATAGAFTACRYRVPTCEAGGDARIALAFMICARPDATLDSSFVPVGLRRGQAVAADLSRSHASGEDSRAARQPPTSHSAHRPAEPTPKRQRVMTRQAPSESPSQAEHVSVKIKGRDGVAFHYRIKLTTPLGKLMDAYGQRRNLDRHRFCSYLGGRDLSTTRHLWSSGCKTTT
jgi:isopenicillin N synthase-like dioxygenase